MILRHRSRIATLAAALTGAVLAPLVLIPSAVAGTVEIELSVSAGKVTFGDQVTLAGLVSGDAGCTSGRTVRLRWRAAGASGFATVAETTTASDGSFGVPQTQPHTGRYRAVTVADGSCAQASSGDVLVRVRAAVDASVIASSTEAGSCVDVVATVSPAKPGQRAVLQRRSGGRWRPLETLTLNGDSEGRGHPCLGWDDIGTVRYRVRWPAQDELNVAGASRRIAFEVTGARWMRRIREIVGRRPVSVSVGEDGTYLFRHLDGVTRTPASNEKLLLAMAMLDAFGPERRIQTFAAARGISSGVVDGALWLVGRGDPIVRTASLARLADQLVAAGVRRIAGGVRGSTSYFLRDWDAPGWNRVARDYVNRPTALTFEGNHHRKPERAAAAAFTRLLTRRGVRVGGDPGSGAAPRGLEVLGTLESKPLEVLLAKMLRPSWNFAAEVLGKGLGAAASGAPGTIAKGASAIESWTRSHGAGFRLNDSSGLSYSNRVNAASMVRLLWAADRTDWGDALRGALPGGGQGTLEHRLRRVQIRAKTGTLSHISALSGWVFAERLGTWIEFSILSSVGKPAATEIEDKIVRVLHNQVG